MRARATRPPTSRSPAPLPCALLTRRPSPTHARAGAQAHARARRDRHANARALKKARACTHARTHARTRARAPPQHGAAERSFCALSQCDTESRRRCGAHRTRWPSCASACAAGLACCCHRPGRLPRARDFRAAGSTAVPTPGFAFSADRRGPAAPRCATCSGCGLPPRPDGFTAQTAFGRGQARGTMCGAPARCAPNTASAGADGVGRRCRRVAGYPWDLDHHAMRRARDAHSLACLHWARVGGRVGSRGYVGGLPATCAPRHRRRRSAGAGRSAKT